MKILGEWNWYLPSWLEWLPQLGEAPEPDAAPAPVAGSLDARPSAS
jgi:hypothetical protein